MSRRSWASFIPLLFAACGDAGDSSPDAGALAYPQGAGAFRYDPVSGRCVNDSGVQGLNPISIDVAFETRDGECGDFRALELPMSPRIERWNLRGADFAGAGLFFQDLMECAFEGTKLRDLRFGYAGLVGTIDSHTTIPGGCPVTGSRLQCSR